MGVLALGSVTAATHTATPTSARPLSRHARLDTPPERRHPRGRQPTPTVAMHRRCLHAASPPKRAVAPAPCAKRHTSSSSSSSSRSRSARPARSSTQNAAGVAATSATPQTSPAGAAAQAGEGSLSRAATNGSSPTPPAEEPQQQEQQQQLQLRVQVVSAIEQVPQHEWDGLVNAQHETNPFLRWAFLHALEVSQSAVPSEGWGPQHVVVRDDATGELLAACPLYLKGHSQGEYVFDSSWANYSHMMGKPYYPKLQSCVPFTPATGSRLLVRPGALAPVLFKALAQSLVTLSEEMGVSSLHVTFPTGEEWAQLGALGFQQRRGIQYHWDNRGYESFDDFLGQLKQRKRKSIRQERKGVAAQGLTIRRLLGSEVTAATWDKFFEYYQLTTDKHWGRPYLKREFFHRIGADMGDEVLLVVAEDGGDTVAAALNLIGSHCLFGRNWGCTPDKEYKHLHFEVCYYQALEEAIARKLPRVEAGAQGEHKLQRGLLPNFTFSAHHIADPTMRSAVGKFLANENSQLQYAWQQLTLEGSPYKDDTTLTHVMEKLNAASSLSSRSRSGSFSSLSSSDDGEEEA